jgi:hypothetical protein
MHFSNFILNEAKDLVMIAQRTKRPDPSLRSG